MTVGIGRDGGDILLSVFDQGMGIPDELLEQVFEPNVRSAAAGERR